MAGSFAFSCGARPTVRRGVGAPSGVQQLPKEYYIPRTKVTSRARGNNGAPVVIEYPVGLLAVHARAYESRIPIQQSVSSVEIRIVVARSARPRRSRSEVIPTTLLCCQELHGNISNWLSLSRRADFVTSAT